MGQYETSKVSGLPAYLGRTPLVVRYDSAMIPLVDLSDFAIGLQAVLYRNPPAEHQNFVIGPQAVFWRNPLGGIMAES